MASPEGQSWQPLIKRWAINAPGKRDILPVLALVFFAGLLAWSGSREKSVTTDELVHILAGEAYWALHDYRMNPENGTLPGRISASFLQLKNISPPIKTDSEDWERSNQWLVARDWWFHSGADHHAVLKQARLSMLLFNLTGLAVIFIISGFLWGRGGAYLSLFLAAFSPNFLGHMPLATSDFAGAWTLVLAVVAYVRLLESPNAKTIMFAGLTAGIAIVCKHSALLLGPVALVLLFWRSLEPRPLRCGIFRPEKETGQFTAKFGILIASNLLAASTAIFLIWSVYGFRFTAAGHSSGDFVQFQIPWENFTHSPFIQSIREWRLLPEAFVYGLDFIQSHRVRGSFLNGEYSSQGFRLYHLWTFLYKTPLPALVLHSAGIGVLLTHLWRYRLQVDPVLRGLIVLGTLYGLLLLGSGIGIGHRHAFVLLYLSAINGGILIMALIRSNPRTTLTAAALALSMVPLAILNANRFIAYINPIGGGEYRGYRHLADSSLDWGQDLPTAVHIISRYKEKFPKAPVYLAYFGSADPIAYGLEMPVAYLWGVGSWRRQAFVPKLEPGLYVTSATVMIPTRKEWSMQLESAYLGLKEKASPIYQKLLAVGDLSVNFAEKNLTEEEWKILNDFEYLRFQRLKAQLLNREPNEVLNGSILVYHVTPEELDIF